MDAQTPTTEKQVTVLTHTALWGIILAVTPTRSCFNSIHLKVSGVRVRKQHVFLSHFKPLHVALLPCQLSQLFSYW